MKPGPRLRTLTASPIRVLAALAAVLAVVLAPQLAAAGTASRSASAVRTTERHHRHHRHHHHHKHHRHHHHDDDDNPVTTSTTKPATTVTQPTTTTTRPAATTEPTTTTTTRPTTTTTQPTTTTTQPTTTTTQPPPDPRPVASQCLSQTPRATVSGAQSDRFNPSLGSHEAVDARGASWTQVDSWPVSVTGSGSLCWNGGSIVGTYALSTLWSEFHHTGGFSFNNPGSVIEDVRVHNYGDAINVRDGAANWTVRGAHTSFIHDDCLQDDYVNAGVIDGSLFDGCYVGISTRPSSGTTGVDGHTLTLTMRSSLLRLAPMPTVYKGPAPGHGGFFKWDDAGRSPKLALFDNVFRVDQIPNHGSLGLPDVPVSCARNTIVWLGGGAFPEAASWLAKCPDTKIVSAKSTWDDAVTTWNFTH